MRTGNQTDHAFWNLTRKPNFVTGDNGGKHRRHELKRDKPIERKQKDVNLWRLRKIIQQAMRNIGKHGYELEDGSAEEFYHYLSILNDIPKLQKKIGSLIRQSDDQRQAGTSEFPPTTRKKLLVLKQALRKMKQIDGDNRRKKKRNRI